MFTEVTTMATETAVLLGTVFIIGLMIYGLVKIGIEEIKGR